MTAKPRLSWGDGDVARAGPILVGVGGSAAGASALEFAFAEAAVHGVAVRPTLVWTGAPGSALDTLDPFAYELTQGQEEADRLLAESVAGWSNKYPDVHVERAAAFDASVASELARLSGSAAMAVVCARSHPHLSPLLLGSVTRTLLWSSGCPLAIVRPPGRV